MIIVSDMAIVGGATAAVAAGGGTVATASAVTAGAAEAGALIVAGNTAAGAVVTGGGLAGWLGMGTLLVVAPVLVLGGIAIAGAAASEVETSNFSTELMGEEDLFSVF